MVNSLFYEKLNRFKQNESPETVLVVADTQELIKIIIAWTNLKVRIADELTTPSGESDNEIWDWLWDNTKFKLSELKLITGSSLSETGLKDKMNPLIGNRVIYPDGTVNSYVQRYLRERVLKLFEAKLKKSTKKTN
jgi:hypothetical protein